MFSLSVVRLIKDGSVLLVVNSSYLYGSSLLSLGPLTLESLHDSSPLVLKVYRFAHTVFELAATIQELSRSDHLVQSGEVSLVGHGEVVLLLVIHTLSSVNRSVI